MNPSTLGLKLFRRDARVSYLVLDSASREALAIDAHPGLLDEFRDEIGERGLKFRFCADTQAWGEGGSAALASQYGAQELTFTPHSAREIRMGSHAFELIDAPGPAPSRVILGRGQPSLLFSGQSVLFGAQAYPHLAHAAAAAEFRQKLLSKLGESTLVYPSWDELDLICSTVGIERGGEASEPAGIASINVQKYQGKLAEAAKEPGVGYVDVREPSEFAESHIPGTRNIPLAELGLHFDELLGLRRIYFSCLGGRRSVSAARTLAYWGAPEVISVSGGFRAWVNSSFPVVEGKK